MSLAPITALYAAQRRQGNFVEYVPLALLLLACVEGGGYAAAIIHGLGATLFAARVLHPFGIADEFGLRPARFIGASATWIAMAASSALILWSTFAS